MFTLLRRVPSVHPFVLWHAPMGHPWPSGARSASCLAAWTNGLTSANNREQHPTRNPRGQLAAPCLFGAMIGRVVISDLAPRPPYGKTKLSHLCNECHRHGCIGAKMNMSTAASGAYPYREMVLYLRPDSKYLTTITPYFSNIRLRFANRTYWLYNIIK